MFTVPSFASKSDIYSKKKKKEKMTRCPSLGSLPSPLLLLFSPSD